MSQQQLIKTNCNTCVFRNGECSCKLDHPVTIEADHQVYTGFCLDKRNVKWGIDKEFKDLSKKVQKENAKFDIIYRPSSVERLEEVVTQLNPLSLGEKTIIVLENATQEEVSKAVDLCKAHTSEFVIKNLRGRMKDEIRVPDLALSENNLINPWFLHILDDTKNGLDIFTAWTKNHVFLAGEIGYLVSLPVFKSLGGNKDGRIDTKIREFKNGPETLWYSNSDLEPPRRTRQESEINSEAEVPTGELVPD